MPFIQKALLVQILMANNTNTFACEATELLVKKIVLDVENGPCMHRSRLCKENSDFSKMLIVLMDFTAPRDRLDVHIKALVISLLESNMSGCHFEKIA